MISFAARDIGERIDAKALVAFTNSGDTVRRLARLHTELPLLAFTPIEAIRNQLALTWGVTTFVTPAVDTTDEMVTQVDQAILQLPGLRDRRHRRHRRRLLLQEHRAHQPDPGTPARPPGLTRPGPVTHRRKAAPCASPASPPTTDHARSSNTATGGGKSPTHSPTELAYTGTDHPVGGVRLLAPVQPTVVVGMAHNGSPAERTRPPQAFLKSARTVTDPDTPVVLNDHLGQVHVETVPSPSPARSSRT